MLKSTKNNDHEPEKSFSKNKKPFNGFTEDSAEGTFRIELEHPIDINLPEDEQVDCFYMYAYVAEANDEWARIGGFENASDLIGSRLDEILPHYVPENISAIKTIIRSRYTMNDFKNMGGCNQNARRNIINNIVGTVENGQLVRLRGSAADCLNKNI